MNFLVADFAFPIYNSEINFLRITFSKNGLLLNNSMASTNERGFQLWQN